MDDFLPTLRGELLFVSSDATGEVRGGEVIRVMALLQMWPCLVEKAYAKLHGSYCHLNAGVRSMILSPLTTDDVLPDADGGSDGLHWRIS